MAKSKTGEPSPIIIVKKDGGGHQAHHGGTKKAAHDRFGNAVALHKTQALAQVQTHKHQHDGDGEALEGRNQQGLGHGVRAGV